MDEYACPNCGWFHDDFMDADPSLVKIVDEHKLYYPGSEIPGSAMAWTEKHKCPKCGAEYEYENSNY